MVSDCYAAFVPGYSGGPVSDFHGVPFLFHKWNLKPGDKEQYHTGKVKGNRPKAGGAVTAENTG
jgi:hypothetical protein